MEAKYARRWTALLRAVLFRPDLADLALAHGYVEPRPWLLPCFMTVPEAATTMGRTQQAVRRMLNDGELLGHPFRGSVGWRVERVYLQYFLEQEILATLETHGPPLAGEAGAHD
jgi:hypothetical protein